MGYIKRGWPKGRRRYVFSRIYTKEKSQGQCSSHICATVYESTRQAGIAVKLEPPNDFFFIKKKEGVWWIKVERKCGRKWEQLG